MYAVCFFIPLMFAVLHYMPNEVAVESIVCSKNIGFNCISLTRVNFNET